jgi:hypothetical protein
MAKIPISDLKDLFKTGDVVTETNMDTLIDTLDDLPVTPGSAGDVLTTDGTNASWEAVPQELPDQSSATTGQFLESDGTNSKWANPSAPYWYNAIPSGVSGGATSSYTSSSFYIYTNDPNAANYVAYRVIISDASISAASWTYGPVATYDATNKRYIATGGSSSGSSILFQWVIIDPTKIPNPVGNPYSLGDGMIYASHPDRPTVNIRTSVSSVFSGVINATTSYWYNSVANVAMTQANGILSLNIISASGSYDLMHVTYADGETPGAPTSITIGTTATTIDLSQFFPAVHEFTIVSLTGIPATLTIMVYSGIMMGYSYVSTSIN